MKVAKFKSEGIIFCRMFYAKSHNSFYGCAPHTRFAGLNTDGFRSENGGGVPFRSWQKDSKMQPVPFSFDGFS